MIAVIQCECNFCFTLVICWYGRAGSNYKIHIIILPTNWLFRMQHSIDIADFYKLCSIGNFFFAGARIFFQSLDAAIFLFSRVSDIPPESLVLPVISTNDRLTLGCELLVWYFYLMVKLSFGFSIVKCYF